jgi:hypothetical protein
MNIYLEEERQQMARELTAKREKQLKRFEQKLAKAKEPQPVQLMVFDENGNKQMLTMSATDFNKFKLWAKKDRGIEFIVLTKEQAKPKTLKDSLKWLQENQFNWKEDSDSDSD